MPELESCLSSPRFWDEGALREELGRVAGICRTCRRCAALCPAFTSLFELLGRHPAVVCGPSGSSRLLEAEEWSQVAAGCFQCQRCLLQCPFAPPGEEGVDLPFLLLRVLFQSRRKKGLPAGEGWLAHPDLSLAVGSLTRPWSNWLLRRPLVRLWLERLTGLDRSQELPPFGREVLKAGSAGGNEDSAAA